jgi:hypothetical protein
MLSAVGSVPPIICAWRMLAATFADHITVKIGSASMSFHGGVTSSTSWPSDSSRAAASRTACSLTGSSSVSTGQSIAKATRSRPGSRPTASANGSAGGGAQLESPSSGPAITSSMAAQSPTVRVSAPSVDRKCSPRSGALEIRPRDTFRPTRPVQAAGIRIEPPPSLPCATGTVPDATAALEPPDEPPGVRSVSHGLRVGPLRRGSVTGRIPNSGVLTLPISTKPASRKRLTRA